MKFFLFLLILSSATSIAHADWLLHRTDGSNSNANYTALSESLSSSASSRLFVQRRTGQGRPNHPERYIGLWLNGERWTLFYEDLSANVPLGLEFSIMVPEPADTVFVHTHEEGDQPVFMKSYLDHPSLNGKPDALVFLSHNYTAGGGRYNNRFSPVTYDVSEAKWYIHGGIPGDEFATVPDGATWNVHVVDASNANTFKHYRTFSNTDGAETTLDHPLLNDNPNALMLVTNVWPDPSSVFSSVTFAVAPRYDAASKRWKIRTLGGSDIRNASVFHIKVASGSDTPDPELEIDFTAPQALISFPTDFGYTYQLRSSSDIITFYNEGLPFLGNGKRRTYPTTAVLPRNHYRLIRTIGESVE